MTPAELDPNRIYAKTAAGEEAMQQRTLVVQRNLRMVLILVDGNATVAELCNKTNKPEMTCSALCELENDGFIEARVEKDSVWSPERQRAREEGLLQDEVSEFSTFGDRYGPPSAPSPVQRVVPMIDGSPEASTGIFSRGSSDPPALPRRLSGHSAPLSTFDSGTVFLSKAEATSISDIPPLQTENEPSMLDNFSFLSKRRLEKEGPDLKPIRIKPPRWYRSGPAIVSLSLLFLLALVVAVALLFPYGRYLPEFEALISKATGQSVKIGDMRVNFYPRPGLLLNHVQFSAAGKPTFAADEMRVQPAVSSLWQTQLVLSAVELRAWAFTPQSVEHLGAALASTAQSAERPVIERLMFDKAEISFAGLGIADLHGEARLNASGTLQSLSLTSANRSLRIDATPEASGLAVKAQAIDWLPSQNSAFRFNALNFQGRLSGKRLTLNNVDFRIFDGSASGSALLSEEQRNSLTGELSFERINLRQLGEALGIGNQFQGDASGRVHFSAPTQDPAPVAASLNADGSCIVTRGSLGDIDLGEAVRRNTGKPTPLGGATRFDRLSGAFRVSPAGYRFSQLSLTAGLLQGNGYLNVSRNQSLSGLIAVSIGRNQGLVPIAISGELVKPLLHTVSQTSGAQHESPGER